ncbi:MAG: hypothetical protein Q7U40_03720 [Desulfatirhabdiaceae bacterium]|nr:hypothetical protein [Desulfatirhabdiaceae bacterium]
MACDNRQIDPYTLIEALTKAGTYIGIAKPSDMSELTLRPESGIQASL